MKKLLSGGTYDIMMKILSDKGDSHEYSHPAHGLEQLEYLWQ